MSNCSFPLSASFTTFIPPQQQCKCLNFPDDYEKKPSNKDYEDEKKEKMNEEK